MKQKRSGLSKLLWSIKCTKSWSCRKSLNIPRKKLISTNLRGKRKKVYALLNNGHRNAKTDQIQNDQIISPVPGCMFLEQVGWGTWLSNKTFKLKRFGSKMSSRAKSFHSYCLRRVWLKVSWLFVKHFCQNWSCVDHFLTISLSLSLPLWSPIKFEEINCVQKLPTSDKLHSGA